MSQSRRSLTCKYRLRLFATFPWTTLTSPCLKMTRLRTRLEENLVCLYLLVERHRKKRDSSVSDRRHRTQQPIDDTEGKEGWRGETSIRGFSLRRERHAKQTMLQSLIKKSLRKLMNNWSRKNLPMPSINQFFSLLSCSPNELMKE